MNCVIGAILTILFVWIMCYVLYLGACGYNVYKRYHCYMDYPYYFKIPFIMTEFIFGFFIIGYHVATGKGKSLGECSF